MHDKDTLQILYDELAEQFKSLKEEHVSRRPLHERTRACHLFPRLTQEETLGSLAVSEAKTVELTEQVEKSKRDRPDVALKVEIERLRAELYVRSLLYCSKRC